MQQIAFYSGLALIVAGLGLWVIRRDTAQTHIRIFDIEIRLDSPALAIMAAGLVLIFLSTRIAPPTPVPEPCTAAETIANFSHPDIQTLAVDNSFVAQLRNIRINIVARCTPPSNRSYSYIMSYNFYNGNGWQKVSQSANVTLLDKNGAPLKQDNIPLDLSTCKYNQGDDRSFQSDIGAIAPLVKSIRITVPPSAGTGGKC